MKLLQFNEELKTSYITVLKHKILKKGGPGNQVFEHMQYIDTKHNC